MSVQDVKLARLRDISMKEFSQFGRIIGRNEDTDERVADFRSLSAHAEAGPGKEQGVSRRTG